MSSPGALAEWLGSGLQSRLQRFDSARRLLAEMHVYRNIRTGGLYLGRGWKLVFKDPF